MKDQTRAFALAVCAGLAVSASANAQVSIVNNISGSFTDVSGTGTLVVTGDDQSGPVTVSAAASNAAFPAGTLNACTNGHAGYGGVDTQYSNGTLPAAFGYSGPVACVYWDDLITQVGGAGVYQQEVTENGHQVQVVEWVRMDHFYSTPSNVTFELKIYGGGTGPSNSYAQYLYQSMVFGDGVNDNGASATVGYQYSASSAEQYSYDTAGSIPDNSTLTLVPGTTGACCLPDGTCALLSSNNCNAQSGVYHGDNSTCAAANCPHGACCTPDGCIITGPTGCTNAGGTYHGDNSTCAQANCPVNLVCNGGFESGDFTCWTQFGDGSFTGVDSGGQHGGNYEAYFGPTGGNGGIQQTLNVTAGTMVTIDFWYQAFGTTNFFSADLGSTNLVSFTNQEFFDWTHFTYTLAAPTDNPVLSFTFYDPPSFQYLDDVHAFAANTGPSCYANCDLSTAVPFLNVNDFICFQSKFAAGDTYANCDQSTQPPVLNVNDFICFQSKFAAGCSAP